MDRPFRVLGVQQVALGSSDKQALRRLWVDLLGLVPQGSYRSEPENVESTNLTVQATTETFVIYLIALMIWASLFGYCVRSRSKQPMKAGASLDGAKR